MRVSTEVFAGMLPRYQPFVLPNKNAQLSINANLLSGGLEAFKADVPIQKVDQHYSDLYQYLRYDGTKQWLFFNEYTDIAASPVFDDSASMMFSTNSLGFRVWDSNTVKVSDTTLTATNTLSVIIPIVEQPVLADKAAENTIDDETRSYVVCLVREWASGKIDIGKSSAPAQTADGDTFIDLRVDYLPTVTFSVPAEAYTNGVTHAYVYRTTVSSTGVAMYQLAQQIDVRPGAVLPSNVTLSDGKYTYTDTVLTDDLGEELVSSDWDAPPDDLQGVHALRNGVLAGYKGKTLYLSELYMPHAWPSKYRIPTDFNIVGLGSFGNTLVVFTEAHTYLCIVTDPATAFVVPIQEALPCKSKRSIVNVDAGVIYASHIGIFMISANGATLLTKGIITDKEWEYFNPTSMRATLFQDRYAVFFDAPSNEIQGFVLDFEELEIGLQGLSTYVNAMRYVDYEDEVYVIYTNPIDGEPWLMRFADGGLDKRSMLWRSKLYFSDDGLFTYAAGKINFYNDPIDTRDIFYYVPGSNAINATTVNVYSINGDMNTNARNIIVAMDKATRFRLYVNNTLRFVTPIFNNKAFRLPAGFRGDTYYFEVEGTYPIIRVQLSTSMGELT